MSFDLEGAKKAGYTDAEIADYLASENKFDASGARKSGYSDAEIISHLSGPQANKITSSRTSQLVSNAGNRAIAGAVDTVLNTPTNLYNLGKAAIGTPMVALGRPDLAPEPTPTPDYALRAMKGMGFVNDQVQPQTTGERLLSAGVQGAVGGAIAPANSLPVLLSNMGTSAVSGLTGQAVTDATGNPYLGMAAGIGAVPVVSAGANKLADLAQKRIDAKAVEKQQNAVRDQTLKDAQDAGYVVPKSAVEPSFVNNRLESIAGKAAIGQEAAARNQKITNDIARQEAGLPKNAPLSVESLKQRREVLAEPYRDLRKISPQASSLLDDLQETRQDATGYWQEYARQGTVSARKEAIKLDAQANAIETKLEGLAKSSMKPGLVDRLRAARVAIAKTHDIERALNVGTGDVSASVLGRMVDQGKPLSGGLSVAGRFQQAFPSYAREGATIPTPGVSKSEALVSLLAGLGGHAALGPAGLALAAVPLASGPVRSGLLSPAYQKMFVKPDYNAGITPALAAQINATDPALRAILQGALQSQ